MLLPIKVKKGDRLVVPGMVEGYLLYMEGEEVRRMRSEAWKAIRTARTWSEK